MDPKEPSCKNCDDQLWVCENHSDKPWDGSDENGCCGCGAGMPCPKCNGGPDIVMIDGSILRAITKPGRIK